MSTAVKLDQYYTNPDTAKTYWNKLVTILDISLYDIILEPSAGTGSFYNLLPDNKIGLDLEPKCDGVVHMDFFHFKPENKKYLIIGNPPFGKNSNTAIAFFNYGAEFADVIAFIVPRTFKKTSVQNRLALNFHLIFEEIVPDNSFIFCENTYDVPCVFQIWKRGLYMREKNQSKTTHNDFIFTSKEDADIAFQRVGVNAGKIKQVSDTISKQSHYFIKAEQKVIDILSKIDWNQVKHNTAGNPSISKSELIELYEKNK